MNIELLKIEDFNKCSNIWDMKNTCGLRLVYADIQGKSKTQKIIDTFERKTGIP